MRDDQRMRDERMSSLRLNTLNTFEHFEENCRRKGGESCTKINHLTVEKDEREEIITSSTLERKIHAKRFQKRGSKQIIRWELEEFKEKERTQSS